MTEYLERELKRLGVKNDPFPKEGCPDCGRQLEYARGYVGEMVLFCPTHGIVWEDSEDAVRRVL